MHYIKTSTAAYQNGSLGTPFSTGTAFLTDEAERRTKEK